jgi:hypothetical protein
LAHLNLPWKISCPSPAIKINTIMHKLKNKWASFAKNSAGTKGKIRISSTSKTKKIIVTKKNRIEKGSRAENLGVKPHSKGLSFS